MTRLLPGLLALSILFVLTMASGCSAGDESKESQRIPTASPDEWAVPCDLVAVASDTMRADGVTFAELVTDRSGDVDARGLDAMIAFGLMARGPDAAGRFEPVLGHLTERSAADASDPPRLTKAVRRNARELDLALAGRACP